MSLGVTPARQRARRSAPASCRGRFMPQRTGRHRMLGLGRADAPGERAERALRAGVAVGADQGRAGQHDRQFRRDDVDDALVGVVDVEQADARRPRLLARRVRNARRRARSCRCAPGRVSTIWSVTANTRAGSSHAPPRRRERAQRHRAGALVQEHPVDRDQILVRAQPRDDVGGPRASQTGCAVQPAAISASIPRQSLVTNVSWIAVRVSSMPLRIQCQVRQRFLPSSAILDHFVQVERGIAGALPVEHHRAVRSGRAALRRPSRLDQLVVPPDSLVAIVRREIADFGAAVGPGIMVGLVIGMLAASSSIRHNRRLCARRPFRRRRCNRCRPRPTRLRGAPEAACRRGFPC